ncbi:hypothetical protein [Candidatus Amarolinea dominans]|uniref:hypothetical protein n=1 Tax=Candidatus Amarolinea dominans TaxID=3140696 RepID=UPI0031CC399B
MRRDGSFFERIELTGDYGEYCIDLLVRSQRQGWRVVEVPYLCVERQSGQSKTGVNVMDYIRRGRHYVTTIGRLTMHHRP